MKSKYAIIIILILVITAPTLIFILLPSKGKNISKASKQTVHFYGEPNLNLSSIKLYALYVVPQFKKNQLKNDWQKLIKEALDKAKSFHQVQFRNLSKIDYEIHPQPIVLENIPETDKIGFDSSEMSILLKMIENLEKELSPKLTDLKNNSYKILVIFYEGEGAFGAAITEKSDLLKNYKGSANILPTAIENFNGLAFVSIDYLTKPYGESILYHEIAHALGIPDGYQNDKDLSLDIMGNGRFLPLEINYLNHETINKMMY